MYFQFLKFLVMSLLRLQFDSLDELKKNHPKYRPGRVLVFVILLMAILYGCVVTISLFNLAPRHEKLLRAHQQLTDELKKSKETIPLCTAKSPAKAPSDR